MGKIKLLDCTLRDGGYINNWNFGRKNIKNICNSLAEARIDVVEVGFLTNKAHSEEDALYCSCEEIAQTANIDKNKTEIAAMIAIGETEMDPISLPKADKAVLDIVRITFHHTRQEIEKAVAYAGCLMQKGYKVCMQPVGTTIYKDRELLELIEIVNKLKPYAFYLVDTLGTLYKKELLRFIYLIDNNLERSIKLGFHSHNNLQMSFSNAQLILEYSSAREFLIDCSLFGMGRGAGNLCTELIAQYMNSEGIAAYNMMPIVAAIDNYINPIHLTKTWGYSAQYYIAAIHNCHPNYASYLMNKQTLNMNQIDLILKNIASEDKHIFKRDVIEHAYFRFQNRDIDDVESINRLSEELVGSGKDVLVLASGKTILDYKERIRAFAGTEHVIVITINGSYADYPGDYMFLSNQKRMYDIDYEEYGGKIIMTSNLPKVNSECIYVDYDKLADYEYEEADNAGLMLLRLLERVGVARVYIAGFDGFDQSVNRNYYDKDLINNVLPDVVEMKNASIRSQLKKIMEKLDVIFLTPSKYLIEEMS